MSGGGLLMAFYGDDFTGSTDAMESLARAGVRTVLFTEPPTAETLARYRGLRAFGVAGRTRAMAPERMEEVLRPALEAMKAAGAPVVHYKVCSTFDSSPTVGSIGRAIDVGAAVFGGRFVPVVVGAPGLGRYCAFGNLFARLGAGGEVHRLDRHPSMSKHPVTPMDEADLRVHLGKQTAKKIGLFDVMDLEARDLDARFARLGAAVEIGLIDLMDERQLAIVGKLLDGCAKPLFVAGSSGVESALAAHWGLPAGTFPAVARAERVLGLCGSRSPVSADQVAAAEGCGFALVSFDDRDAADAATKALNSGQSVIVHSLQAGKKADPAEVLPRLAAEVVGATGVRRVAVAGGDTSGAVAAALGVRSLEMVGELTRGAPLCRASAPGSPADGIEITFKGGQIGPPEFFDLVRRGSHG